MQKNYLYKTWGQLLRQTAARYWRHSLASGLGLALTLSVQAQQRPTNDSFFTDDAGARRAASASPLATALRSSRSLTLDVVGLRTALDKAPLEQQLSAKPLTVVLPLPDGSSKHFLITETPVMAPALAAQFPDIKTYSGVGVEDPGATIRLDLTPQGFHAQVLSATTGDFFIDPTTRTDTQHYLSFWRRDMPGRQFSCGVKETSIAPQSTHRAALRTSGPVLRTYRLAVAATGEYTTFHGGTVNAGFAAIVTSVNRVVGVYEKELAVRMVLVAGNGSLVYTNAATDPYTNSDASALLTQNQANLDALIGSANYDIGHVFSTGGGGLAGLGVVCSPTRKAQGETGSPAPVGDAFDIDYVAHEMGHQFGGNHTFNGTSGSCSGTNRNASTAYEPGSGTTIMAYAGICGVDDTQANSNAYFHVASYEEIQAFITSASCGTTSSTGNVPPTVAALPASRVLPIGTPFKLTANGYDTDNDPLTYNWEEYDLGPASSLSVTQVAGQAIPLFRSFDPTPSPTRYFPRLSNLISNTSTLDERLPTVTRPLNFRVTLRDQHLGSQGVIGGVNSSATVALSTTSAAGPFLVTAPNTAVTLAGGSSQPVTWNVAGTTANGVNCATVNIRLSTDGGLTYPTLLLAGTANDGSEAVTLPSVATTTARIMVEAADNYFFDISNANFTITATTACAAPTNVSVTNITANSASVSFTGSGAVSYVVTTSPATTTQTITGTTATLSGLTPGTNYTVNVVGNCADGTTSTAATATFATVAPPVCNSPTNLVATVTGTTAVVTFTPGSPVTSYTVTTTPATTTQTVTGSPITFSGLTPGVVYTANIVSNCVGGGTSAVTVSFATAPANDECAGAISLTSGATCVTTTGTVAGATQSQAPAACSGSTSTTANDVWYSFVATSNRQAITATSSFDGVLELFSGTCGNLSSLGCVDETSSGSEVLTSTTLTPNTRYYVRYFAYTEATAVTAGTFTICVTTPALPPANDECAGAISLTSGATCVTTAGTIAGATQSQAPSTCSGDLSSTARDVWYSFVATGTTHVIQTTGTFDGVLQAFSGACGSLTSLSCVDAIGTSETLTLTALTPNTRYYVRYYPYSSSTTAGTFNICVTGTVAPTCAAPTNLVVTNVTTSTATVSFTPGNTLGSTSTSYTVTTTPATTTQTVTGSPVTLTGLTPGTTYTINIVNNCAGIGTPATTATTTLTTAALASVSVLYQTGDLGQPGDNVVRPYLQLVNTGTAPVAYSQLTVRYWLTVENFSPLVTQIDWAQLGTSQVSARYVALPTPRQGALGYVEYTFLGGAGNLAAGNNSGPILTSLHKQNWTNFDETNDWSYQTSGSYTTNSHLTVYQEGRLISGTEPAALTPVTDLRVYAGNQDTSPTTSAINVYLQVGNVGTVPVNYSDLTVRYWFTPNGTQPLVYPVDYAVLGANNFSLQTGQLGTQTYAELRFAAGLGTLYPTSNTGNVQFKIRKADWSPLIQTDDYSFRPSAAVTEQPRITAYLNGQLVFGTEPTSTVAGRDALGGATITATTDNVLEGSPNPFTDQVQLRVTLARPEAYTLTVYDVQGRQVAVLPSGTASAGQPQEVVWHAGDYAAGLYLVRLTTATTVQQLKILKQ